MFVLRTKGRWNSLWPPLLRLPVSSIERGDTEVWGYATAETDEHNFDSQKDALTDENPASIVAALAVSASLPLESILS